VAPTELDWCGFAKWSSNTVGQDLDPSQIGSRIGTIVNVQAEVDGQRSAQSSMTLGHALGEWLETVEVEDSTRDGYIGYIKRTIRPAPGAVPISKLLTRTLETFYAELRRCRAVFAPLRAESL
jgi:hypothetical protein